MTEEPSTPREAFGQVLAALRAQAGLSGRDVAEVSGTDQSTISRAENGQILPSRTSLERLLDLYARHGADPEDRALAETAWQRAFSGREHVDPAAAPSPGEGAQAAREAADLMERADADPALLREAEEHLAQADAALFAARLRLHQQQAHDRTSREERR